MENELFLWPYKNMDFWKIENSENVVEIKWSHNCFEDYKNLALDFYDCGYKTFEEVINSGHDNVKSDMWFGVLPVNRTIKNNKFLYRQPNYGWRYFYATFIY